MQLFMWQHDIVGVAHYTMDCLDVLGALPDASRAMHQPHLHQPRRLEDVIPHGLYDPETPTTHDE